MLIPRQGSRYCSYLLRCVHQRGRNPPRWHFTLEDTQSGERRAFATLDALIVVLHDEFSDGCSVDGARPDLVIVPEDGAD